MIWKISFMLCLAVCVSSHGPGISEQKETRHYSGHHEDLSHIGEHKPEHHDVYAWAYPSYEFSYKVEDPHTHDNKGQEEHRDGDKVTGMYWLIQPDGLKRVVKYTSDHKDGFHADVTYIPVDGVHYEVRAEHGHGKVERKHDDGHGLLGLKGHDSHGDHHDDSHDRHEGHRTHDDDHDRHDGRRAHDDGHDRDDGRRNHDDRRDYRGHIPYHGLIQKPYYGHRLHY